MRLLTSKARLSPVFARLLISVVVVFGSASCASVGVSRSAPVGAQAPKLLAAATPPPGGCEAPATGRKDEIGCYLSAVHALRVLGDGQLFWHIDRFASRSAANAARGPRGTVVQAFGRVLLYTIAEKEWRPAGGERLATVGPLPYVSGSDYMARYMEGAFKPGMLTTAHRHSGAEAWYVLEGAQCLETPEGITMMRAGESAIVTAGPPMVLSHVGAQTRRSVVLVLHESSKPWITRVHDWVPVGRCPG